ncbi:hypothetical protein SEA_THIMANN_49 [Gordonia phage Thimann]|nr:hypothetical protein SEA_THIMANN_49 [Gordonia phage Thimann]
MRSQCTIDGCEKHVESHGLCTMHWKRMQRNGDPNLVKRGWGHGKTADVVGYTAAHQRVKKVRGPARAHRCAHCSAGSCAGRTGEHLSASWAAARTELPTVHRHPVREGVRLMCNQCACCGDPCRGEVCIPCLRIINPRRESQ